MKLTTVTPAHFEWLYQFLGTLDTERTWSNPAGLGSREEFARWVQEGVFLQFIVEDRSGEPCGLVRSYGAQWRDGTVRVAGAVSERVRRSGLGMVAIGQLIDHTFAQGAFRKVYFEATRSALEQYWSVADKIFEVEGILRSHQWNGLSYEDVVVCGLFRDDWYNKRTNFESRLERP